MIDIIAVIWLCDSLFAPFFLHLSLSFPLSSVYLLLYLSCLYCCLPFVLSLLFSFLFTSVVNYFLKVRDSAQDRTNEPHLDIQCKTENAYTFLWLARTFHI